MSPNKNDRLKYEPNLQMWKLNCNMRISMWKCQRNKSQCITKLWVLRFFIILVSKYE
jgi:hypothetical protein